MLTRVTAVEEFRRFMTEDYYTETMFLKFLRGEKEPTEEMKAGTAFHSALEHIQYTNEEHHAIIQDGYYFAFPELLEVHLPVLREQKGILTIGEHKITGTADAIDACAIYDHKLTENPMPDRYFDSLQWRLYLMMFKANKFVYNLFKRSPVLNKKCKVYGCLPVQFYRYKGMEEDIKYWVDRFAEFVKERDLNYGK